MQCPALTSVVGHLAAFPERFAVLVIVDFAAWPSGTVVADWASCSEEVPGAACPSALVAEVAGRGEVMLASDVEDVKSLVVQVEG